MFRRTLVSLAIIVPVVGGCSGSGGSSSPAATATAVPTRTPTVNVGPQATATATVPPPSTASPTPTAVPSGEREAFILATDFQTGSFATVSLDAPRTVMPAGPQHVVNGDAVVRTAGGLVYVINRFLADNIQIIDPQQNFATTRQCSTDVPPITGSSNPHDIVVVDATKAYVTLYDKAQLLIVNPSAAADCSDFVRGSIDLSSLADADGIPEMDQMALVGDRLYVSLQRLDRTNFFVPAELGAIAVIDTATDQLTGSITLSGKNPFAATKGLTVRDGALLVAEAGALGMNDGGIERVDLTTNQAEGFFITEAALGGDLNDFLLISDDVGYAIVAAPDFTTSLVSFGIGTQTVTPRLTGVSFIADIELDDRGELFVSDRTVTRPGVRIFNAMDGAELTTAPIDIGLAPFEIVFLH